MRNRSRLDLICVPNGSDTVLAHAAWPEIRSVWARDGLLDATGAPTSTMVSGGARGILIDLPSTRVVYGNQLGGVRVRCGDCGAGLAREFARAVEQVRTSGVVAVPCPACGTVGDLQSLAIRPPVRLGRSALIIQDAQGSMLTPRGQSALESWLGPFSVVLRRVS